LDGPDEEEGLVDDEALQKIFETKELDYLTHIVLRMFENKTVRRIECMCKQGSFFCCIWIKLLFAGFT
jgi:hypothetical protein